MNCGHIPTRPCVCDDGDRWCSRFPWYPTKPVDDDWQQDGDDDDEPDPA